MNYKIEVRSAFNNPQALEGLYRSACREDQAGAFREALVELYEETPNLLLEAWVVRLRAEESEPPKEAGRRVKWALALVVGVVTGLLLWALSDPKLEFLDFIPYLVLWWSPIAAAGALVFLAVASGQQYRRAAVLGIVLLLAPVYVMLLAPGQAHNWQEHYLTLASIHLPLLAWIALGMAVLGLKSLPGDRFSFLIRSIEVAITAGLYLMAGMAFGGITAGMFEALDVDIPPVIERLAVFGGFGLLPVLAVASIYDPRVKPGEQDFEQGLSKFIATMMRLLLPLTLLVLVIYIFVIPFKFMEPFENRDVLIVYNLMLFAIMGLLLGATPIRPDDLSPKIQAWLRNGIIAVALLAVLVSLYALSATIYRTVLWEITINRLTIIGWNSINIGILAALIYKQFKDGAENWVGSLRRVFSWGTNAYVVWGVFQIVVIPWLFRY